MNGTLAVREWTSMDKLRTAGVANSVKCILTIFAKPESTLVVEEETNLLRGLQSALQRNHTCAARCSGSTILGGWATNRRAPFRNPRSDHGEGRGRRRYGPDCLREVQHHLWLKAMSSLSTGVISPLHQQPSL